MSLVGPAKGAYQALLPWDHIEVLKARARMLLEIRHFFADRGVLEVDTPLLCPTTGTDIHIESLQVVGHGGRMLGYLQTSPEFAMKKLLATGSGSIYQLSKAFRDHESGPLHRTEFTMLEWYRVGWDHVQLMKEVADLLVHLLGVVSVAYCSYQSLFERYLGLNPHTAGLAEVQACVCQAVPGYRSLNEDRDVLLQLLFSHVIEPHLGPRDPEGIRPTCVYDFPESQAALAQVVRVHGIPVAQRFEYYMQGIELANGYHELTDGHTQRARFEQDLAQRKLQGKPCIPIDEALIQALDHGFPSCAGVALGVDRLLMFYGASNGSI